MHHESIFIVSASRAPNGKFLGQFAQFEAHTMMSKIITNSVTRLCIDPELIDEVIIGQIFTAGSGQNPARQSLLESSVPVTTPAHTVNMGEASGLKAIYKGYLAIHSGQCGIVLAGGQDSASRARHVLAAATGDHIGNFNINDTLFTDTSINYKTDLIAENWALCCNVTQNDQDNYIYRSFIKVKDMIDFQEFQDELVPVINSQGPPVDEVPRRRPDMFAMMPIHDEQTGFMIPGNSAPICDGAAMVILCSASRLQQLKLTPLAKVVAIVEVAVDIDDIIMATTSALRKLLVKCHWKIEDIDIFEIDETYAAQVLVTCAQFSIGAFRVNVGGGGLIMGEPGAATGPRMLVTLIHSLARTRQRRGVLVMATRDGIGMAMAVERIG